MNYTTWLTVISICALGAMSPGPSLAVVLRHTLAGGQRNGAVAAVTHGVGIGLYALLCISGLAFVITRYPAVFTAFEWAGAVYLAWLGMRGLLARANTGEEETAPPPMGSAARDGFLIVFLNPKVAVFFIALFSQVIGQNTSVFERSVYVATAWLIDTGWYLVVAWLFSRPAWLGWLKRNSIWFERLFGLILLSLSLRLVYQTLA